MEQDSNYMLNKVFLYKDFRGDYANPLRTEKYDHFR